jgi:hypothetical protein
VKRLDLTRVVVYDQRRPVVVHGGKTLADASSVGELSVKDPAHVHFDRSESLRHRPAFLAST